MPSCLAMRGKSAVGAASSGDDTSSFAQSMTSLSPSEVDQVIMDMLNIENYSGIFHKSCTENPVTTAGKRVQVFRLLGTVMVPILALMAMVGTIFVSQIQGYMSTQNVRTSILLSIELSELINVVQRERDMSALYASAIGPETKAILLKAYTNTDQALDLLPSWITTVDARTELLTREAFINYLNRHRYNLDLDNPMPQTELQFYTSLMSSFMAWFYSAITEARSGTVWKDLVATQELLTARNSFGIERVMGAIYFTRGGFANMDEYRKYTEGYDRGVAAIRAAREFSATLDRYFNETLIDLKDEQDLLYMMRIEITQQGSDLITVNKSLLKATQYFENMTASMNIYLQMQKFLVKKIEVKLLKNINEETQTLVVLGSLFGMVMMLCPVIVKSVYNLTTDIQSYSMKLVERTRALNREKKRTDSLLYQILPKSVAERLKNNQVINAEQFANATIFFSDIVGFTSISGRSSPIQVVNMLNSLYTCFDNEMLKYDVYKVETIGDAYMVASGLPQLNGDQHVVEIACLSLDLMDRLSDIVIPHMPGKTFRMRIGIHTGSVVAGVVGTKMPRYCLFGKTVSRASQLESTGEPGKIHISEKTYLDISNIGGYVMRERSSETKDVGIRTYWLICRVGQEVVERLNSNRSPDTFSPVYADQVGALLAQDDQTDDGNVLMNRGRSPDEMCEVDF